MEDKAFSEDIRNDLLGNSDLLVNLPEFWLNAKIRIKAQSKSLRKPGTADIVSTY
jgi:hypothetical protein